MYFFGEQLYKTLSSVLQLCYLWERQGKIKQEDTEANQNVLTKLQNQDFQPLDHTSNRIPLFLHKFFIPMLLIVLSLSIFVFPLLYLHSKNRYLLCSSPIHSLFFLYLLFLGNVYYSMGSIQHLCTVNPQIYFLPLNSTLIVNLLSIFENSLYTTKVSLLTHFQKILDIKLIFTILHI